MLGKTGKIPQIAEKHRHRALLDAGVSGAPVLISFLTTSRGTNDEKDRRVVLNNATADCSSKISLMTEVAEVACVKERSSTDLNPCDTRSIGWASRREKK